MKYRKRPGAFAVYVPGHGLVADDRLLEGDLNHLVPSILVACEPEVPVISSSIPLAVESPGAENISEPEPELDSESAKDSTSVKDQAAAILAKRKRR